MLSDARLLLVDDQPANLHFLASALEGEYELLLATSGAQALDLAQTQAPDLILLDIMMPGMDGLEVLRRLRAEVWGRDIAVILVTADDRTETQIEGLEQGADDFIAKPLIMPVVKARVRSQLARRRFVLASREVVHQSRYRELILQLSMSFINLPVQAFDNAINRALRQIGEFFAVDRAYVFDYDFKANTSSNTHEWCAAGVASEIDHLQNLPLSSVDDWVGAHTQGESFLIEDVHTMPEGPLKAILLPQQIISLITVPLMDGTCCLGYVGVDVVNPRPMPISSREKELLHLFAQLLVSVIKRRQVEEHLLQAANVFEYANEGILITDPEGVIVDVNAAFSTITGYSREEAVGKTPRLLKSGKQPREFYCQMWHELLTQGHWKGEIWNRRKNGTIFPELLTISGVHNLQGQLQNYVALFSDVSEIKAQQRQLEQVAYYDMLTGLPNRVLLSDRLKQAMAQAERHDNMIAVVMLDLDRFKEINDLYGHACGDRFLNALSKRMKQALREGDTLARLGGDEFVAILLDLPTLEASIPLLERLLKVIAAGIEDEGHLLQVTASMGISLYPQAEIADADQLLRQADQAMYQAKQAGKCTYRFFDSLQDSTQRSRFEALARIEQGLHTDEFRLFYQPKVNMRTGAIIGFEALIRWQHPEQGLLPPVAFLPWLENHPLMVELGDWVLATALQQLSDWQAQGLITPISVNVDAVQLSCDDFIDKLSRALARHPHIDPALLELEVLETGALNDIKQTSDIIRACHKLGVRLSLDDFGTGYSSLAYLKHLKVDFLKIDRSFVRDMLHDPDDLVILSGVVGLAEAFGHGVIAEGVETLEHGEFLMQMGCDNGQGYAIARPMPAAEVPDWIAAWRPDPTWAGTPSHQREAWPLLMALVEHRAWIIQLQRYLNDEQHTAPPVTCHDCHLGDQLDGLVQRARQHSSPELAWLTERQEVHAQIHADAHELVELKRAGQHEQAHRIMDVIVLHNQRLDLMLRQRLSTPLLVELLAHSRQDV